MKGMSTLVLIPLVILITMLVGFGIYFLLYGESAGQLIAWVSPFAQGVPDAFG